MSYENIKLWFAKDKNENIVTIDEINDENKNSTYLCPVCGSNLKPKAVKSKQVTSHFAHIDASKCNSESQIHFWFKHKFIEKGDKFTVASDKNQEYICKEILVEQSYETSYCTYRPDVTVLTECGNTIFFEMAFTNKKKVQDYLDIWLELKNIVVEVVIKDLITKNNIPTFKALFYEGKCFNTKRNDTYYNTIGKYKEKMSKSTINNVIKERIRKLDWFWNDVFRFKKGEIDISDLAIVIDSVDKEDKEILDKILSKNMCQNILSEYLQYKLNNHFSIILNEIKKNHKQEHLEFIKAEVTNDYYYNVLKGYILILHKDENCWHKYEMNKFSPEEIVSIYNRVVEQNISYITNCKKIDNYNKKLELILECIENSDSFEKISRINPEYEIECWSNNLSYKSYVDNLNWNTYRINFELTYISSGFTAMRFALEYDDLMTGNLDDFLIELERKMQTYFENLELLSDNLILQMGYLVGKLKSRFADCSVEIVEMRILDNIYEISIRSSYSLVSYYFSNKGLLKYPHDRNVLMVEMKEIEKYIVESTEEKIINYYSKRCYDCKEHFYMGIGELQFFFKKGLTLPKRCKCCRDNRKQFKLT